MKVKRLWRTVAERRGHLGRTWKKNLPKRSEEICDLKLVTEYKWGKRARRYCWKRLQLLNLFVSPLSKQFSQKKSVDKIKRAITRQRQHCKNIHLSQFCYLLLTLNTVNMFYFIRSEKKKLCTGGKKPHKSLVCFQSKWKFRGESRKRWCRLSSEWKCR